MEGAILLLPAGREARDRRRRQPGGVLAEQHRKGLAEIPGRQAPEVEHRQHFRDLRRPAHVRRQDLARESLPLPALVDALVVDARGLDLDGAAAHRYLACPGRAIAHNHRATDGVALVLMTFDVAGHLGLESLPQHLARAHAGELVERHLLERNFPGTGVMNYSQHGWRVLPPGRPAGLVCVSDVGRIRRLSYTLIHNLWLYLL